ncbi:hypothetical protein K0M31_019032 [Melipona bicolor]|uniref:Uncharacterized protein n=1 Tax=Melipona bicolor TaxID=60889 RepID=A0AA40FCH2_9HYME|nr:hypothetical protein K0M31_019032 [Melipona bicolor]
MLNINKPTDRQACSKVIIIQRRIIPYMKNSEGPQDQASHAWACSLPRRCRVERSGGHRKRRPGLSYKKQDEEEDEEDGERKEEQEEYGRVGRESGRCKNPPACFARRQLNGLCSSPHAALRDVRHRFQLTNYALQSAPEICTTD